jgi:hypothetical protein
MNLNEFIHKNKQKIRKFVSPSKQEVKAGFLQGNV